MIETGSNAPQQIRTEVCIVGSGPAGMTVALELERLGVDCVLLESGGRELDQEHTSLNQTQQVGIKTDSSVFNRVRGLGGTSALWGGLCRRLDAMDLEQRSWVPGSGWPIELSDLLPYYDTAHRILELPPAEYDLESLQSMGADRPGLFEDRDFQNVAFYYDKSPMRFGPHYGPQLASSTRIRTFLDSTVVDIMTDDIGQRVVELQVKTLGGKQFQVQAQRVVLAAGAIQTARLLLNADGVHKTGLGNANDMVGRYFLQHPVLYGPLLLMFNAQTRQRLRREGKNKVAIRTAIQPAAARQNHLLNFHFFVLSQQSPGRREVLLRSLPAPIRQLLQNTLVTPVGEVPEYMSDLQSLLAPQASPETLYVPLEIRAEQAPNPDSRITLGADRDQLGQRRAVMDWRLTDLDRRSMHDGMRLLGGSMARNGIGRIQAGADQLMIPDAGSEFLHGGNHQYGTTRMGDSPRSSVVDRECRVHDLANLYIAGSAVFPTTGHANPTLTIVALAARLAAHLAQ